MTMMYYIEFEFSFHGLHEVHVIFYQDHPLSLFWLFATCFGNFNYGWYWYSKSSHDVEVTLKVTEPNSFKATLFL